MSLERKSYCHTYDEHTFDNCIAQLRALAAQQPARPTPPGWTQAECEFVNRLVVASHLRTHAGLSNPGFFDCREGFCGQWRELMAGKLGPDGLLPAAPPSDRSDA